MAALGPTLQLFIDQMVHFAEHPFGDPRRVVVRPSANLAIEDGHQFRRTALLVVANYLRQIGKVPLLSRATWSDEGLVAQRLAHRVLSRVGLANRELTHRGTVKVKPCRLTQVQPERMDDPVSCWVSAPVPFLLSIGWLHRAIARRRP